MAQLDEGRVGVNLLDNLRTHKGGLLQLKSQLYWYNGRGWDKNSDRICVILDAASTTATTSARSYSSVKRSATGAAVLLLIDGSLKWIWVAEQDMELISTHQEAP